MVLQDPPDMVRATLPEPQFPAMQAYILRHTAFRAEPPTSGNKIVVAPTLPVGGRDGMTILKETNVAPTSG